MKRALKDLIRDVHMTFSSDYGKRVLEEFRRTLGDVNTFDPDSERLTCHNEGKRAVYLWIKRKMEQADEPGVWEDGDDEGESPEVEI